MLIYNNFWIPATKTQLLNWFKKYKPEWKQADLKKRKKTQLLAIYLKERSNETA